MSTSTKSSTGTRISDSFTIRDKEHQSTSLRKLCMSEMYSDLTIVSQEGTKYPAHRAILAARSDYFSKLLYGGLKETKEEEVKIMCTDEILKAVLCFLYGGEFEVDEKSDIEDLMNLLNEVRLMCLDNMKAALEDFIIDKFINCDKKVFSDENQNVINIFNYAVEKDFSKIIKAAKRFLIDDIDEIFTSNQILNKFSAFGLKTLISGNDLDILEIDIFKGVFNWLKNNIQSEETDPIDSEQKSAILAELRLDLMTTKQLTMEVRPSGLFSDTQILDAIQNQHNGSITRPRNIIVNKNICLESLGATVLNGESIPPRGNTWSGVRYYRTSVNEAIKREINQSNYNARNGYTMCELGERMEISLPSKQAINKIRMLLYDRDSGVARGYSYRIESSITGEEWETIADYSNSQARSWQTLFFPERRVKIIGITGVQEFRDQEQDKANYDDTPSGHIHIVSVEAMLDTITQDKDRVNKIR